jgi:hypothetical protein
MKDIKTFIRLIKSCPDNKELNFILNTKY